MPVEITKEVLSNIPSEIVIYEILTYIIYETESYNGLTIKDLFGYFNEGEYRIVYQIWSNIKIGKKYNYKYINIKKFPQLERLTSLYLYKCNKIEAIPQLERLTSLSLHSCDKIEVIPKLERLTFLNVQHCPNLEDIEEETQEKIQIYLLNYI